MRIVCEAHAKINWSLNVLGVREDGYHELDMLMQTLALSDEITFERARWLTLSVDGQALPVGTRNLVVRAANLLNDYMGQRNGARIRLVKRIPARAGLGGGSADCACALLALNRLWDLRLPAGTLLKLGAQLGADVPFCMTGGLARVRGIGERLTPMPCAPEVHLAMVTPGGGLSTAAVFRAWDEMRARAAAGGAGLVKGGGVSDADASAMRGGVRAPMGDGSPDAGSQAQHGTAWDMDDDAPGTGGAQMLDEAGAPCASDLGALAEALMRGDLERAQALSGNSLEVPAIQMMPEIAAHMAAFRRLGARFVRMTGSGSTVFAAFATQSDAIRAAQAIPGAIYTHTLRG